MVPFLIRVCDGDLPASRVGVFRFVALRQRLSRGLEPAYVLVDSVLHVLGQTPEVVAERVAAGQLLDLGPVARAAALRFVNQHRVLAHYTQSTNAATSGTAI